RDGPRRSVRLRWPYAAMGDPMKHNLPHVYVAAPYADRMLVRDVHVKLVEAGMVPASNWANSNVPGDLQPEATARPIHQNDTSIAVSDAVLVLARPGAGGEMFCEVTRALVWGTPVYWVGRRILSAFRPGVRLFGDVARHCRHA